MKKKRPVRRPLVEGFSPPRFPLRTGQEIADALGVTRRRLEQLIKEGEDARSGKLHYPESIGYLTRDLLPKDERGRYLPVSRERWAFVLGVLSQNVRLAQKRDDNGKLTADKDFERDQAHWVGTVHLVPTGEPGTYRIDKGRAEDLPNVRVVDEVDAYGEPVYELTYADAGFKALPVAATRRGRRAKTQRRAKAKKRRE